MQIESVKVVISSKNQAMKGLCQHCFSSGVEITFDEYLQTICDNCKNPKKQNKESKLSQIFNKIPNLEDSTK